MVDKFTENSFKYITNIFTIISDIEKIKAEVLSESNPDQLLITQLNVIQNALIENGSKPTFYEEPIDTQKFFTISIWISILMNQERTLLNLIGRQLAHLQAMIHQKTNEKNRNNKVFIQSLRDSLAEKTQHLNIERHGDSHNDGTQMNFGKSEGYCFAIGYYIISNLKTNEKIFIEHLKNRSDKVQALSKMYEDIYPNYHIPIIPINATITHIQRRMPWIRNGTLQRQSNHLLSKNDMNEINLKNVITHLLEDTLTNQNDNFQELSIGIRKRSASTEDWGGCHAMGFYYSKNTSRFYFVDTNFELVSSDNVNDLTNYILAILYTYQEKADIDFDFLTHGEYPHFVPVEEVFEEPSVMRVDVPISELFHIPKNMINDIKPAANKRPFHQISNDELNQKKYVSDDSAITTQLGNSIKRSFLKFNYLDLATDKHKNTKDINNKNKSDKDPETKPSNRI